MPGRRVTGDGAPTVITGSELARARAAALRSPPAVHKAFSFTRDLRDRLLGWPPRVGRFLAAQFEAGSG